MLWKNRNKRVGLCMMIVSSCLILATVWAVLAIPETALAAKKENPGGNIKQQDISTKVTLLSGSLTGDGSDVYADGIDNIDCKTGRRRTIWVKFGNNCSRTMWLNLGNQLKWVEGDPIPEDLANGIDLPNGSIDDVSLSIAVGHNVSGLGEEFVDNVLYCSPPEIDCMLTNMRMDFSDTAGFNWRLYFGPGPRAEGAWPGGFFFSNPDPSKNAYVTVVRENPSQSGSGRLWQVRTVTVNRELVSDGQSAEVVPGFLYFTGTKPNDPHIYVGTFDIPWSCDAESLE